jgi:hypothetical protein
MWTFPPCDVYNVYSSRTSRYYPTYINLAFSIYIYMNAQYIYTYYVYIYIYDHFRGTLDPTRLPIGPSSSAWWHPWRCWEARRAQSPNLGNGVPCAMCGAPGRNCSDWFIMWSSIFHILSPSYIYIYCIYYIYNNNKNNNNIFIWPIYVICM